MNYESISKNNQRKTILENQFGSHVYGTNVETSDHDYKGIFIPSGSEIILGRDPKTVQQNTKKDKDSRNSKDDIDKEFFSLQQYLKFLAEGQTVSLDMLFTPNQFYLEADPIWYEIWLNRDKLLNKQTSAFVGYTKQQAAKYGLKGFRVSALRDTLDWIKQKEPFRKIHETDVLEFH